MPEGVETQMAALVTGTVGSFHGVRVGSAHVKETARSMHGRVVELASAFLMK